MHKLFKRLRHYTFRSPNKIEALARLVYTTKILSAKRLRKPDFYSSLPPLMTLQVNNVCNLRCVQCWEWGGNGVYKKEDSQTLHNEMSTEQWIEFINEVSPWKPYLYFFGGEPLLRKDIGRLIEAASAKGLLTALTSNTTLLSETLAEDIVKSGLDYYMASLDGPEEINNKIRRGNDVYNKVVSGIKNLVQARAKLKSEFPIIEVATTITEQNADYILETAQIVNKFGVDRFKIQLGMFTTPELVKKTKARFVATFGVEHKFSEGFVRDTSRIDTQSLAKQDEQIKDSKWTFEFRRDPRHGIKDLNYDAYFKSPEVLFGEKTCHVPWKRAVILPNGDVVGCPLFPEAKLGNVTKQKFIEIWNGAKMRTFRKSLIEDGLFPFCNRCYELYEHDES